MTCGGRPRRVAMRAGQSAASIRRRKLKGALRETPAHLFGAVVDFAASPNRRLIYPLSGPSGDIVGNRKLATRIRRLGSDHRIFSLVCRRRGCGIWLFGGYSRSRSQCGFQIFGLVVVRSSNATSGDSPEKGRGRLMHSAHKNRPPCGSLRCYCGEPAGISSLQE